MDGDCRGSRIMHTVQSQLVRESLQATHSPDVYVIRKITKPAENVPVPLDARVPQLALFDAEAI